MSGPGNQPRKSIMTMPPPKPCPRCYAPMREAKGGYECARHGFFAGKPAKR